MKTQSLIEKHISQLPLHEFAFMTTREVIFSKEARDLCEKNTCGKYGTSWTCPPGTGSLEACITRCNAYKQAFLFSTVTEIEDAFDMTGWENAQIRHEKVTADVADVFRRFFDNLLILSTKACLTCQDCTYPDAPCRNPERMSPAVESYGIMVNELTKHCNLNYINGENTVTYFSMIFFD